MASNKLKVMLSFMREINDGNQPTAKDYEMDLNDFADILEACQDEGLVKGLSIIRGGRGNPVVGQPDLSRVKLTVKGLEYLDSHSGAMKTYKGLKELREWLPF